MERRGGGAFGRQRDHGSDCDGDRLTGLAGDYLLLDRPADAARTMQRALALAERAAGRESIEAAYVLADLARMSRTVAPTAEVRGYAERALAIAGNRPGGATVAATRSLS